MRKESLTSVIVTYNSAQVVPHLLADIQRYQPEQDIIIIDNASQDQTVCLIEEQFPQNVFPQIQLIKNSSNLGYARAVNQGVGQCQTDFVLLLNPDIRILGAEMFNECLAALSSSPQVAAVAPLQFKEEGQRRRLTFTWSYYSKQAFDIFLAHRFKRPSNYPGPIQVSFLNAGCLFLRREIFIKVGMLNEKYFLYGEEPDLGLKFMRYGYTCLLVPQVGVIHHRELSIKSIPLIKQFAIKMTAGRNILDALIVGWMRILLDRWSGDRRSTRDFRQE